MPARPSQIRHHRILGAIAVVHGAIVLGLYFAPNLFFGSWWWLGLASSLWLWLVVLAVHPGRSLLRFLIPTILVVALFAPCATYYRLFISLRSRQWLVANDLEKLPRTKLRMVLYSIDADHIRSIEIKKGYRRLGADEVILPDDMFNSFDTFARMDNLPSSVIPFTGPTVNSIANESERLGYGQGWQILRKTGEFNEAETEEKMTPDLDREPYKAQAVLGYSEIVDQEEQRALMTALARGARHGWNSALCHNPRHGLYVETGTTTIDFSICFECQNVYLLGSKEKMGRFAKMDSFSITHAPAVFDAALKRHGIPLPYRRSK
jgi:hypothetical protein